MVSVVMPTYNSASFVAEAIRSALEQTLQPIEIIVVDDKSADDTIAIVSELAQSDSRIRIEALTRNSGPAAARNRGFAMTRAPWIAVLDSDDMYLPDRLERLVTIGEERGADVVSDNLLQFTTGESSNATPYLEDVTGGWITIESFLKETRLFGNGRDYGYLKPIFRAQRLRALGLAYNERLRIAEDEDLILRGLVAGLRYWYEPAQGYLYRRHSCSTSHRLSAVNAAAMCAASAELISQLGSGESARQLRKRHGALVRGYAFTRLVDAIKQKRWLDCISIGAAHPNALPLLRMPIGAGLSRIANRFTRRPVKRARPGRSNQGVGVGL